VKARRPGRVKARRRAPDVDALEEELRQALGTRVRLVGSMLRGRIELPYGSAAELERIHARLTAGASAAELERIHARLTGSPPPHQL
jgi:hypothetical protein